jgi:hypothetical protein
MRTRLLAGTAIAVVTAASIAFAPAASALQYGMTLSPDKVKPGGTISVTINCPFYTYAYVTSEGFEEPIYVKSQGQGMLVGSGKVGKTPGQFMVKFYCSRSGLRSAQFTVLDGKPAPKPIPKPKPKVPVKPKGAPQTGEGTV